MVLRPWLGTLRAGPTTLCKHENGRLVLIAAKAVNDIRAAGVGDNAQVLIDRFDNAFKLGTVSNGPGSLRFFDINTVQNGDLTVSTNADDKLNALT